MYFILIIFLPLADFLLHMLDKVVRPFLVKYFNDSSRRRAPAAADTESIEGTFIKPGPPARVGSPSQRSAKI